MGKAAKLSARERLREERSRAAARQRRNRTLLIIGSAVAVVAVVVGVIVAVQSGRDEQSAFAGQAPPATLQSDGSIVMARQGVTKPVLEVYEDFQCPACKEFETVNNGTVQRLAAEGKVKVVYKTLAFVNPEGSLRAAGAGQCAATAGKFTEFHDVAFENQPDERVALTLNDLKGFGEQAGITDPAFATCVDRQKSAAQIQAFTKQTLSDKNFRGTPTLILDGRQLNQSEIYTVDGLTKAVTNAA
ncbi:MAG: thioredoxin domain-containing protein [Streptosporangiales bacterium]|nr:thioredoxin domain-containing protein [Streptosporangiales bacterium]